MVRFGMCGCGGFIENAVLPQMQKVRNARAVAAFDPNKVTLERVCRKFGIKHACSTFGELLKTEEAEAIYIASPNALHKQQTILSAEACKHVFCQKPMALKASDCREMIQASHHYGVKLGIGFCYRFGGAQQKTKKLIEKQAIGRVSYIYLSFNLAGYNKDTVGWRCVPKLSGGGPLMDIAPHLIDLASFFLEDKVVSIMAYVRPRRTKRNVEIDTVSLLEFSKGAAACMDTSFVRGNLHNYTVVGTKGEIHASCTMRWWAGSGRLTLEAGGRLRDVPFSRREHIEQEIRLFCRAVERDEAPPVPGEAGLHAQAVVDAIYTSGRTGRRCRIKYEE